VIADDPNEGSNDDNESLEGYDINSTSDQDELYIIVDLTWCRNVD
jgi:hypothetical protein